MNTWPENNIAWAHLIQYRDTRIEIELFVKSSRNFHLQLSCSKTQNVYFVSRRMWFAINRVVTKSLLEKINGYLLNTLYIQNAS